MQNNSMTVQAMLSVHSMSYTPRRLRWASEVCPSPRGPQLPHAFVACSLSLWHLKRWILHKCSHVNTEEAMICPEVRRIWTYWTLEKFSPMWQLPKGLSRVLLKICDFALRVRDGTPPADKGVSCPGNDNYHRLRSHCVLSFFLPASMVLGLYGTY